MSAGDTAPAVVVAGDALVDLTPAVTREGRPAYEPHPGGSCLNVAVGLGRAGVPTAFLARLSDDPFGGLLRRHLADSGVSDRWLLRTPDPTTLAFVHLAEGQASYSFHAAGAADRGLEPEHLGRLPDAGALPEGAALHLGSIALVLEPVATTLDGLLRREAGRRLVTLDPNVRPGLVADRAAYLRRWQQWLPLVDVLKVSAEDLAWLHPDARSDADVQDVVASWLSAGVAVVLVTDGERGARAWSAVASAHVPAPRVEVVDTVGAGDAFSAGVLAHLHDEGRLRRDALPREQPELERLLRAAVLVAADTCTRPGADPPRRTSAGAPAGPA